VLYAYFHNIKLIFTVNNVQMNRRHDQSLDTISHLDLKNPDFHNQERGIINETWSSLQNRPRLHFNPESGGQGFWSVTRYEDVLFVLKNPKIFSASHDQGGMRIFDVNKETSHSAPHILSSDPPQHTRLRAALSPLFSREIFEGIEHALFARVKKIMLDLTANHSIDFVSQVSIPVSSVVMAKIIGVSEAECELLVKLSDALINEDDSNEISRCEAGDQLSKIFWDLTKQANHATNLPRILLAQLGSELSRESAESNFRAFLIASNETTRHALSRSIISLCDFPNQKKILIENPSLLDSAVSELLRWTSPLLHIRRTALCDISISNTLIKKGDKVVVWYQAANSDSMMWEDSMELNVDRYKTRSTPHLAFGAGAHKCPGKRLAELQLKTVLREFISLFPNFSIAKKPIYLRSNFISGVKELRLNLQQTK